MNTLTVLTVMWYMTTPAKIAGFDATKHTFEFTEVYVSTYSECVEQGKGAVTFLKRLPNLKNLSYNCESFTIS